MKLNQITKTNHHILKMCPKTKVEAKKCNLFLETETMLDKLFKGTKTNLIRTKFPK